MGIIEKQLKSCSKVIISPGIDPSHPVASLAKTLKIAVQSELELGAEAIRGAGTARALIAVTGSNGKTTVVSWLEHIFLKLGLPAISAGNIGRPLTDIIEGSSSRIIIAEVSSFQLQTMHKPLFDIAAVLNISPNHLDRHHSLSLYGQLKCKVQALLRDQSHLLVSQSVDEDFSSYLNTPYRTFGARKCDAIAHRGNRVFVDGFECECGDLLKDLFEHDIQNFCAVLGIAHQMGCDMTSICSAAQNFRKPHHRLEWICSYRGIDFFDDSKATSPDAVIKAVKSLNRPIVLIAGGVSKNVSFEPWIPIFLKRVRKILAIGDVAQQMVLQLKAHISTVECANLTDAFDQALFFANAGDAILLSPGCSSFDMFKNYQDRGRQFAALAKQFNREDAKK